MQPVIHTDGITYERCLEHQEITDKSLGLVEPKPKPRGPMQPALQPVRMKGDLGKQGSKPARQATLDGFLMKKEPVAIDLT